MGHKITINKRPDMADSQLSRGIQIYLDDKELSCFKFEITGGIDQILTANIGVFLTDVEINSLPADITMNVAEISEGAVLSETLMKRLK